MKKPNQFLSHSFSQEEAGNVFIIILLGIVLFATLSITVARSMRGEGTTNLSQREVTLAATEILSAARKTESAVNRVRRKKCSENELSFENDIISGYENANAPVDLSCHIFNKSGGSATWPTIDEKWLDGAQSAQLYYAQPMFPSYSEINGIGIADKHELLLILMWLDKSVCMKLNQMLGVTGANIDPPQDTGNFWSNTSAADLKYTGTFEGAGAYNISHASTAGKLSACLEGDVVPPAGTYHFYHVLIAR